jgi:hypothetical protein
MKAEQTRCPQEAGPVSDGAIRSATSPERHPSNARPIFRNWRILGGQVHKPPALSTTRPMQRLTARRPGVPQPSV